MRTSIFKNGILAFMLLSVVAVGCDKDDEMVTPEPPAEEVTIADIAASDTSFSFLLAAAVRANLDEALAAPGTLTVFAPTNNAFRNAGFATIDAINTADPIFLATVLEYHILGSEVTAAQVPAGPNAPVATLGGTELFATRGASGVFINGVPVATADVQASNGVVHVIERVLLPPSGNIVETAIANPSFSYLVAAVLRASTGSTDVAGVLSGDGPLTVFAPVNEAFIAAGFATIDDINATDPDVLTAILTYHVVGARVFSSDLSNGQEPATVNGGTVTITLGEGASVQGNSNAEPANIVGTDIVTTNGVIHVIDQVLLP